MEVADSFIPTAGVVGLLPMVTYFLLLVAFLVFTGNFILSLSTLSDGRSTHCDPLLAVITFIAAFTYYLVQTSYRDMLSDLGMITDSNDRLTLIRESYNAIGQYRYMNWLVTAPLFLRQITAVLNVRPFPSQRRPTSLLVAGSGLYLFSFIGHQQLSFDNEILIGAKAVWGLVAAIVYGFILFTLYRSGEQISEHALRADQRSFQRPALVIALCWGVHLLGYFLTLITIDFNWIQLVLTLTDLISIISVSATIYSTSSQSPAKNTQ